MSDTALAYPRKQFFIEMFTRDIGLEDCILDLIDNSMDAMIRLRGINIENEVLAQSAGRGNARDAKSQISVTYSDKTFSIVDDCGGIRYDDAVREVFCFGHSPDAPKGRLGVYGIGMKRAIFKIGNNIRIESNTGSDAFRVEINVEEWAKKDETLEDWTFPITRLSGAALKKPKGTTVVITQLHAEVKARINDGTVASSLRRTIAQSYPFFLGKFVDVQINNVPVERLEIPFGSSGEIDPGITKFEQGGVKVVLLATIAPKQRRNQELAGWYVLCNGRVVVNADKTALTGWGAGLPAFHSKYIGFIGLALFISEDPSLLPWTTSKRGLNRETLVFQRARNQMTSVAKPVITFLNEMYPSDLAEHPVEREIANRAVQNDFRQLLIKPPAAFKAVEPPVRKRTARVQFDALVSDLEKIRKKLRRPRVSASEIGRLTFDHYVKTECAE